MTDGKYLKSLEDAIRDGDAVEAGVPLRASDYDVKLENRTDGTYFMIVPKHRGDDGG